jgi:hypothetical protein
MKFGECYERLERGMFISKRGWDESFLWLKQRAMVAESWCKDPILKSIAKASGGAVMAEQTICKYDAINKKIITGFVPQQEDMASDDWYVANPKILDFNKNELKFKEDDLFKDTEVIKKP